MGLLLKGDNMGKRFDTLLFPGGRNKVFTLSYDDGVTQDRRLVEIFNRYNVKCTFNLGCGNLGWKSDCTGNTKSAAMPFTIRTFHP